MVVASQNQAFLNDEQTALLSTIIFRALLYHSKKKIEIILVSSKIELSKLTH
jgi:hypothetical protein